MLCIIAGAFAEKLYSAASVRVGKYIDEPTPGQIPHPAANQADPTPATPDTPARADEPQADIEQQNEIKPGGKNV